MSVDPLTTMTVLGAASKIPGLVSSTLSSLKTAREIAKDSKDSDLKEQLSDVYSSVLDLREALHELQKASVKREGQFGYYFAEGDSDPLCPKCYENGSKLVHLRANARIMATGAVVRSCIVCDFHMTEVPPRAVVGASCLEEIAASGECANIPQKSRTS